MTTVQTRKTMVEVSNMIIATMGNKFKVVADDVDDDDSSYLYKEIDGLHYYLHRHTTRYVDNNNQKKIEYGVIRTNYKIRNSKTLGHPKSCFYGYMKHCMPTRTRKNHIEEKITDLTGVCQSQWYDRYEDEKSGDYRFTRKITEEQFMKKHKLPYGFKKITGYDGKKYLDYKDPDKVNISYEQININMDNILNRREILEKTIKALYRNTDLPLACIGHIMRFI